MTTTTSQTDTCKAYFSPSNIRTGGTEQDVYVWFDRAGCGDYLGGCYWWRSSRRGCQLGAWHGPFKTEALALADMRNEMPPIGGHECTHLCYPIAD